MNRYCGEGNLDYRAIRNYLDDLEGYDECGDGLAVDIIHKIVGLLLDYSRLDVKLTDTKKIAEAKALEEINDFIEERASILSWGAWCIENSEKDEAERYKRRVAEELAILEAWVQKKRGLNK